MTKNSSSNEGSGGDSSSRGASKRQRIPTMRLGYSDSWGSADASAGETTQKSQKSKSQLGSKAGSKPTKSKKVLIGLNEETFAHAAKVVPSHMHEHENEHEQEHDNMDMEVDLDILEEMVMVELPYFAASQKEEDREKIFAPLGGEDNLKMSLLSRNEGEGLGTGIKMCFSQRDPLRSGLGGVRQNSMGLLVKRKKKGIFLEDKDKGKGEGDEDEDESERERERETQTSYDRRYIVCFDDGDVVENMRPMELRREEEEEEGQGEGEEKEDDKSKSKKDRNQKDQAPFKLFNEGDRVNGRFKEEDGGFSWYPGSISTVIEVRKKSLSLSCMYDYQVLGKITQTVAFTEPASYQFLSSSISSDTLTLPKETKDTKDTKDTTGTTGIAAGTADAGNPNPNPNLMPLLETVPYPFLATNPSMSVHIAATVDVLSGTHAHALGDFCEICNGLHDEGKILICGDGNGKGCDKGYHTYCLSPKVIEIPDDDWFCQECVKAEKLYPGGVRGGDIHACEGKGVDIDVDESSVEEEEEEEEANSTDTGEVITSVTQGRKSKSSATNSNSNSNGETRFLSQISIISGGAVPTRPIGIKGDYFKLQKRRTLHGEANMLGVIKRLFEIRPLWSRSRLAQNKLLQQGKTFTNNALPIESFLYSKGIYKYLWSRWEYNPLEDKRSAVRRSDIR